jgi:hypothetical protein
MPSVGNLHGVRQGLRCGFAVPTAAITRDDGDCRMFGEPGFCRRLFAIRQQSHSPAPLQITHDGSIAVVPPPRPVVDADDTQRVGLHAGAPTNDPQQGVLAESRHRTPDRPLQHQPKALDLRRQDAVPM